MDLEKFARVFGLEYLPQPRELPPQPYFPNGIGYGAHRVPHSELPAMGSLPENMDALGGFYRHIRIGRLDESSGFLPLLDGLVEWLDYEELADAPEGWSIVADSKTHELVPNLQWQPSWVIFARLVDDSVLFADTAQPECPVFWLPTGYTARWKTARALRRVWRLLWIRWRRCANWKPHTRAAGGKFSAMSVMAGLPKNGRKTRGRWWKNICPNMRRGFAERWRCAARDE